MARRKESEALKEVVINMRIEQEIIDRIDGIVDREKLMSLGTVSRSSVIRAALIRGLEIIEKRND